MAVLDSNNEMFRLAADFVTQSNRNIFLTGKAGTGKTTFLRHIREYGLKQSVVVAPTGVAAINAGGTTIHSFFQLPFSPFLPAANGPAHESANNRHSLLGKMKLNRERIKIFQQLELLVIDEISMVRCDVLDAIDTVLRHYRHRHSEAFGGVQVLLIGDMYQLPPVAGDGEWNILSQFYPSPYFFDSNVMRQSPPVYIAFEKIYRQQDDRFIDLLNQVRNNALDTQGRQFLEKLYRPHHRHDPDEGYITLTTHNYKADAINKEGLARIRHKLYSFEATIEGEFGEKSYPADSILQLKEGAQVMFVKNDTDRAKRYFNGKIGHVSRITQDAIFVQCRDEDEEIEVTRETWENIRYGLNKQTNKLEEELIGSFTQYPLRLAWAITIHKSQGLTFEKAVIDAGAAFAAGQVYVALSRCTSAEGIILQSRINPASLLTDERIVRFSSGHASPAALAASLEESKRLYQQDIVLALFDLSVIMVSYEELKKLVKENVVQFNEDPLPWIAETENKLNDLGSVAVKFRLQLEQLSSPTTTPEQNPALQQRVKDAAAYFIAELEQASALLARFPASTDSKALAKLYNELARDIIVLISERKHLLQGLTGGFSIATYYTRKKSFIVPPVTINIYVAASEEKSESPHPALHYQLRQLRNRLCEQKNLPVYMVASSKSIDEMTMFLPQTEDELLNISGFGTAKTRQYGDAFLDIIRQYCIEHGLSSRMNEKVTGKKADKKEKPKLKTDTKELSYRLFKEGKTIPEIATERNLAISTIEGHLSFYVSKGMIPVTELVQDEKLAVIAPYIANIETGTPLSPIMEQIGNKASYSELRLALAAKEWEKIKDAV